MIKDLPAEINDYEAIDWESGLRGFFFEMEPDLDEAVEWVCQTHNLERTAALVDRVAEVMQEEEDSWYTDPNSVMSYHHY